MADALHDAEWNGSSSVVNLKLCSVMCAPLKQKGEVFGVIYLGNDDVVSLFDERALEPLTVFAAQASLLVQNALLLDSLRRENVALREAITTRRYGDLVGSGASMREVFRRIEKVAATDISVLITGETGTGKEVVARELHRRSTRASGPFVAVNCGAIPETLLESELFGHAKGAFTGAVGARIGRFQAAAGGTLFLDEVAEMAPALQVKLLRALQDGEIRRVGESMPVRVDVRIIAATNQDLRRAIGEKRFREDLFYRLNVVPIRIPPLRERLEDVPLLAVHFLAQYNLRAGTQKVFTPAALAELTEHAWPGNVRELENMVEQAAALSPGAEIGEAGIQFEPAIGPRAEAAPGQARSLAAAVEEAERSAIQAALQRCDGDLARVALELGVSSTTLWRKMKRLDVTARQGG